MGERAMQTNDLNVMITISKYLEAVSPRHLLVLNDLDLNQATRGAKSRPDIVEQTPKYGFFPGATVAVELTSEWNGR